MSSNPENIPSISGTIPGRFRAVATDKLGFALMQLMDYQIHFLAELDGMLDAGRLARAMALMMDAEPVLGSRFVRHWRAPWWQRQERLKEEDFFTLREGGPKEVQAFINEPLDSYRAPQVKARIVRSGANMNKDILCLKFSHVPVDGAAVKDCAYLLADIYRRLGTDASYCPEPNTAGSRSARQVSRRLTLADKLKVIRRDLRNFRKKRGCWSPLPASGEQTPRFVREVIGPRRFQAIKSYGRNKGATINDMLITAYYRALYRELGPVPGRDMGILTTADLRRYLPEGKTGAICCLSSFFYSNIGTDLGADFEDTLGKVVEDIGFQKSDYLGLGDYPALSFFMDVLPYSIGLKAIKSIFTVTLGSGHYKGALTNLGIIDEDLFRFDGPEVTDAYILVPVSTSLGNVLITGTTTFKDTITLASGFLGSEQDQAHMERIYKAVSEELPA